MRCLQDVEKLQVRPTRWHDPDILMAWQLEEDFYHLCDITGLLGFAHHVKILGEYDFLTISLFISYL